MNEFLKKIGFNEDGKTYIYSDNDSFFVKQTLKNDGFMFSTYLKWHSPIIPAGYEGRVIEIPWDKVYTISETGFCSPLGEGEKYIKGQLYLKNANSDSEYVFTIGDKIKKEKMLLVSVTEVNGMFGPSWLHKFDYKGNIVEWFTTTGIKGCAGATYLISATVKDHKEYRGEKITLITRARLEEGIIE